MRKILFASFFSIFALTLFSSCDLLKSDDNKISKALIGKFYEDDRVDEDGTKTKDIKGEFYKDGKLWQEATVETVDDETFETRELTVKIKGDWKVKDKFIYYTFDYNSIKIDPEIYMFAKDRIVKSLKEKNTPDKVIEYDASKIIYENSDGKRYTMKKSY